MLKRLLLASTILAALAVASQAQSLAPYPKVAARPTNPTGNATASLTAMGLGVAGAGGGWSITPQNTGAVQFDIFGGIANGTASDGAVIAIIYGATAVAAAPANAAAVPASATVCTNPLAGMTNNASTAAVIFPFHLTCFADLTPGQAWWADVQLADVTGGTVTITGLQVFAKEVQ
jgi:hypothetical protein